MSVRPSAVVVLAAGEGTRMRSTLPKLLHKVCGRALVEHVLAAVKPLQAEAIAVVVGHGREQIIPVVAQAGAVPVVQEEQLGTGHAARVGLDALPGVAGTVVVTSGDTPLLITASFERLIAAQQADGAAAAMLTFHAADPTGYGRVIRNEAGQVARIVEHRDATDDERLVDEVSASVFAFDSVALREALNQLSTDNAQNEEYLGDVIDIFVAQNRVVTAVTIDEAEALGVNDRSQLATARTVLNGRIVTGWMKAGVTVVDPARTWVDVDVTLAADVTLYPNTTLQGATNVCAGAQIGPDCILTDTTVGKGATVVGTRSRNAEIGAEITVGPGVCISG